MRATPVLLALLAAAGLSACSLRQRLSLYLPPRAVNARGGDLTIRNARIWTGDPHHPWADALTVRKGRIVALDAETPAGQVYDLGGRLVVPGMWDAHTHPQAPYVLFSPEAPTLFGCKTADEVLERLQNYVQDHPEDRFPRLFGWMSDLFPPGRHPTRHMIDAVVSNVPVYLVKHNGHAHWANTKALEFAHALERDPPDMKGDGHIERDPETGLATGYLEETEYAATHGVLLNAIQRVQPYTPEEKALLLRAVLEEYPKLGITSIWTKDGDLDVTRTYERVYRTDALPVRAMLDHMYTPYSRLEDIRAVAANAKRLAASGVSPDFLRADIVKLFIDLPITGWKWMFEPYANDPTRSGRPAFPLDDFKTQMKEADRLGLQINVSVYGDRGLAECFDAFEETYRANPPRARRHGIEHAEYIRDEDLPRFRALGITASMNPNGVYPDKGFQDALREEMGARRLHDHYQRYSDLVRHGALMVNGSDFPLFPMDSLVGIHLLVAGSGLDGTPKGGLWPHKLISVEDALISYTVAPAKAAFMEDRLGQLKPGYYADFVALSANILAPDFDPGQLMWTKACLTVLNGHVLHRDFSTQPKEITFAN